MLANDNMKGEAAFLFRQMNAMPEHRRLGIIPGMGIGVSSSKDLSKFKDEGKRTASTVSFSKKVISISKATFPFKVFL